MTSLIASHELVPGHVLKLIHGDLTQVKVDAIVNAANSQLVHGGGVAAAILRQGGPEIQAESDAWVREHGPVSHDQPAITGAGHLPCRYVIHAVGPIWGDGDEDSKLHHAVYGSLSLAEEYSLKSIALPAISTGIFGFPKERAAGVILEAIADYFEDCTQSTLQEVQVVLFDPTSVEVFAGVMGKRFSKGKAPK
jgi:O-acetyl-ADP-ribose deacetylase (regulator of RNase III)